MKVKDLKKLLKNFDNNDEVILSRDEEGNGYSPLDDVVAMVYVGNTRCSGDVYIKEITGNLEVAVYSEDDLYHGKDGQNAIVLYPKC